MRFRYRLVVPETSPLTTAQVARRLDVTTQTVINHVKAGRLPATKLPASTGTYLFDIADVETFEASLAAAS